MPSGLILIKYVLQKVSRVLIYFTCEGGLDLMPVPMG
jgi:hypothetical protein